MLRMPHPIPIAIGTLFLRLRVAATEKQGGGEGLEELIIYTIRPSPRP